jgi:osmotically-inducible protein OsmY
MSASDLPVPVPQDAALVLPSKEPGVAHLVERRLRSHSYPALREISCEYRDRVLVLRGRLPTYYLKQVAQTVAGGVEGVERVDNHIEVVVRS